MTQQRDPTKDNSNTETTTEKNYWVIMIGGGYGPTLFEGAEKKAEEMRAHKANWEQAVALKRPADETEISTKKPSQCWNHENFNHIKKGFHYSCDCGECNHNQRQ